MFDVIVTVDHKQMITFVSSSVERTFGYAPKELHGTSLERLLSKDTLLSYLSTTVSAISDVSALEKVEQLTKKDGTQADITLKIVPLSHSDDQAGWQLTIRDVTEYNRLRMNESIAQRLEIAGQVAGQVAHDFNNMLTPMLVYPEIIKNKLPQGDPLAGYLTAIEVSANKIAHLNQELLTLCRRGHCKKEVVDLNSLIREVLGTLPLDLQSVVHFDNTHSASCNILGSDGQLHRAILNVVMNACEASPTGETVTVQTKLTHGSAISHLSNTSGHEKWVLLSVADNGIGIPRDVLSKIFDPFFTTKSDSKRRGTGLGLSVTDAVVKDHDGLIDVITNDGNGTTFNLYFPSIEKTVEAPLAVTAQEGNESILVVDDDDIVRDVATKLLTQLGYEVTALESGRKAVALLKERAFDLLILDMMMPNDLDGTETYRQALTIRPGQRAIIVSGFADSDRVNEAMTLGVGAFVKKPFTRIALASTIRQQFEKVA
jgi:two-component system, cell cycle sensor histidine kinase and response regulator CckA